MSSCSFQACGEYATLAQTQGRKWQRMLSHEHEQRRRLEDMVEQLARQHSHLEQAAAQQQQARASALLAGAAGGAGPSGATGGGIVMQAHSVHSEEDEDNEFFDAEEDDDGQLRADFIVQVPIGHRRTPSGLSTNSQVNDQYEFPPLLLLQSFYRIV